MSPSQACRCPPRPYFNHGSLASGSTYESSLVSRWEAEHGANEYARMRDELADAIQRAEAHVGSGEAVLAMVADIFQMPRPASTNQEKR